MARGGGLRRGPIVQSQERLKNRARSSVGDIRRILAPSTYIFFASAIPALAFGQQLYMSTDGQLSGVQVLIATAIMGVVQAVVGGQPLLIVGVAEPIILIYTFMYSFAKGGWAYAAMGTAGSIPIEMVQQRFVPCRAGGAGCRPVPAVGCLGLHLDGRHDIFPVGGQHMPPSVEVGMQLLLSRVVAVTANRHETLARMQVHAAERGVVRLPHRCPLHAAGRQRNTQRVPAARRHVCPPAMLHLASAVRTHSA